MAFQPHVKSKHEGLWSEKRAASRPVFIPHSLGPREVQSIITGVRKVPL